MILRAKRAILPMAAHAKDMAQEAAIPVQKRNNKQMGPTRRAVCSMQAVLACMFAFAAPAQSADLYICWVGGSGYTMTGRMQLSPGAMAKPLVTEGDVTDFEITGYHRGREIGSWSLAERTASTTWFLRFEPDTMNFPVGGNFGSLVSQGWNANGNVDDCGNPGFGFNSGNYAQDVCINGKYIRVSSIDPATPLRAQTTPPRRDCKDTMLFSKTRKD